MRFVQVILLVFSLLVANFAYAEKNKEIINLLKQESWQWLELSNYRMSDLEIQVFKINHNLSPLNLTEKIFNRFKGVFQQIQIVKKNYILSGLYKNQHVLAYINGINKTNSEAYISLLKDSKTIKNTNINGLIDNLLPMAKKTIVSLDDINFAKSITVLNVNMPFEQLNSYLQKQLQNNQLIKGLNQQSSNKRSFWLTLNFTDDMQIQIYAKAKSKQTLVAISHDLKVTP